MGEKRMLCNELVSFSHEQIKDAPLWNFDTQNAVCERSTTWPYFPHPQRHCFPRRNVKFLYEAYEGSPLAAHDPKSSDFTWSSTYSFCDGNPLKNKEKDVEEWKVVASILIFCKKIVRINANRYLCT